jgi:undecaprenyl-diphosphatase
VLVAKAESFFQNHGIASVALCRFVPFLRGTVPLVAGMAGMSRRRFFIVNVISASVWGPAHVLPAQFAGKTLQHLRQGNWSLALWCGVALVAAGLAAYLGQRWVRLHVARRPPAAPAADLAAPAPTATAA